MDPKRRRTLLALLVAGALAALGLQARSERAALAAQAPATAPAAAPATAPAAAPATPAADAPALTATAPAGLAAPPTAPIGQGEGEHDPVALSSQPSPVDNDPVAPELPQTAAWKRDKSQHLAGLLARDTARLEGEAAAARARGDAARAAQLDTLLARSRAQLGRVRADAAALAEAAKAEPPEPVVQTPSP